MKNIVLIGMPGCGKSTIAKILGKKIKKEVIEMDSYIEHKYNMTIKEMFNKSEVYFRDNESEVAEEVSELENKIISTGGGIVVREKNISSLKKKGIIIFINRSLDNIISDIDESKRPLLKNGREALYKLYEERYDLYKKYSDIEVINNKSLDLLVNQIIDIIKEKEWA